MAPLREVCGMAPQPPHLTHGLLYSHALRQKEILQHGGAR
eukprot:CAMPEP_0174295192 /NCGR_PEP_ID=MMETSP0809-20121228/43977_1 /TAXON_ID=73025 ORGANISM="Eutreptiella gymnastica-like, Strain CCMP1594" /NCGR_SAMPLE_ID=MMETSP0809 /ASSEMBLY_ACC=CAM_ASM_000658 /LENGTH=39 /DNA_ID= /DNA_START= /DNA_END= /DNA_ORIENTATION=